MYVRDLSYSTTHVFAVVHIETILEFSLNRLQWHYIIAPPGLNDLR